MWKVLRADPAATAKGAEFAEAARLRKLGVEGSGGVAKKKNTTVDALGAEFLHGISWQEAEILACNWMKKNGYRDASITRAGSDGGIDVDSKRAVCQVKHHLKPVGISEIQRLYGIAASVRKKPIFFSAAGYTPRAMEWASAHKVECYRYPPIRRA